MKQIVSIAMYFIFVCAASALPEMKITPIITPGAIATEGSLMTGSPTTQIGHTGCNLLTNFGAAIKLEFKIGATPVEVSNFGFDSATFSVVRYKSSTSTTTTPLNNISFGAYNYGGGSSPWIVARNASGTQISSSGSIVSTNLSGVSSCLFLQHNIPLGTSTRPVMTDVGDYYEYRWNFVGHYTYQGITYSFPASVNPTIVKVQVIPDLNQFAAPENPSKWFSIGLHASTNLNAWFPVPGVLVETPLPTSPNAMIALVEGKTIPGIDQSVQSKRLFLRWEQK